MTHELLAGYHSCGVQNPQDVIFLSDNVLGILRFEMRGHKRTFLFVGTHFKTSWDSKGMAIPLARGHPIGARNALLAGESKGGSVPLAVVSKGGSAALAGGIQWRAAPSVAGRIQ